jgi:DNA polymerase-3 subunit delta'
VGPEGVGKRTFATGLAQALLCERSSAAALDPCESCPSCLQVKAGTHPDVLQAARPEDKHELPIQVIRELCLDLGLRPLHGDRRIAIVDDADDLNDEASNAFLKTLEEPPPGAVLILIATSAEGQIETVVSRCRVVRFDPLPEQDLAELLVEQGVSSDPIDAGRLARLGEGSIGRARGLADPGLDEFRREMIDALADPRGFDTMAFAARFNDFVKEAGTESVHKRSRARLLVGELTRFFRGILWQTAGLEPPSLDAADRQAIAALASRLEPEDVFLLADRCLVADYQIQRNVYLPLIPDSLAHDLGARINR